jgi:uncharacterized protein (DUF1015 family)
MAEIKSFRGLRYTQKAGEIGSLCCPPYDIIGESQRQAYLDSNSHNVIRLELPACLTQDGETDVYAIASMFLNDWVSKGILKEDEQPSVYIYEMSFPYAGRQHSVKGFISLVKLEPFEKGIILPHEETASKAKEDRYQLMSAVKCNISHIYSLYIDDEHSVDKILEANSAGKPDMQFTDFDHVTHSLWVIDDSDTIGRIAALMADKQLFIADGHHRYETALRFNREKQFAHSTKGYTTMMMVNMSNDDLLVLPTHRVLAGLTHFDYTEICERCSQWFKVTPYLNREKGERALQDAYDAQKIAVVMFTGDNNYTAFELTDLSVLDQLFPDDCDAYKSLDVNTLQYLILGQVMGIDNDNPEDMEHITYTRIADQAIAAVDAKQANCCFLLNPTKVEQIRDVAQDGEVMPRKSTYFYPKLTTGLVMNRIVSEP